ncbi:RelE cytotoxic translational repressor of toxin-antitoxin stability system (modular protein) [Rhodospirillaceae bacterium LM-1]|nr:RelE cytotoxic translational repressor of toxin-antitoxin stability system (modular protein) [Rhodospirillaceae bacterium LM-1]
MQTVVETPDFLTDAKAAGLREDERMLIVRHFAEHPSSGDEIKGTGGARKTRLALRHKGKSGGLRVISFFSGDDVPVFLLNLFTKGDKIDLTQAERNELRTILAGVVDAYRKGAKKTCQRQVAASFPAPVRRWLLPREQQKPEPIALMCRKNLTSPVSAAKLV